MTQFDKLISKILEGKTISTDEAIKILTNLGYTPQKQNSGTSHITYKKGQSRITLVLNQKEIQKYLIRQLQAIIDDLDA